MHLAECTKIVLKDSFMIDTSCDSFSSIHTHPFWEFVYVVEGKAVHTLGQKSRIVQAGDYFLVDLNNQHGYTAVPGFEHFKIINCMFMPAFLNSSIAKARKIDDIITSYVISFGGKDIQYLPTQDCYRDEDGTIGTIVRSALIEYRGQEIGYEEIIRNLMMNLIIHLIRNASHATSTNMRDPVRYVQEYVRNHYAEQLTLSEISQNCYISLSNLSKKFTQSTGMTFRDYLQKVRIEKACSLLSFTKISIDEVALMLGYSEPSFFYHSFKKNTNMTPLEYRKKNSGSQSF